MSGRPNRPVRQGLGPITSHIYGYRAHRFIVLCERGQGFNQLVDSEALPRQPGLEFA